MKHNYSDDNIFKLYDYLPIGVCVVDKNYKVVYWNKCLEGWTNRRASEIIGSNLIEIYPHLGEPAFKSRLDLMFENRPPMVLSSHLHKYIFPVKIHYGKFQSQYATLSSLPSAHSNDYFLLIAVENVTNLTERVNSYREMKNQALDELRKRQSIELRLKQYAQKLEESNATKDKLFSIIAHDLIGPISSQFNLIDGLIKDFSEFSNDDILEALISLKESAANTYALIDDLLTWSRSQLNKIICKKEVYNLFDVVTNTLSNIWLTANVKNIEMTNQIPNDTTILCDLNMLVTVLRNITTNAIKFTNIGGKIIISSFKSNGELRIDIADNGVGMDEQQLNNLFQPGKVVSTLGTANEHGTGLGLLISSEFVSKLGGRIEVKSRLGEGSIFSIYLPTE